ncbi:unnamed protein product [Mytilus coruscus]|uniref:Uncharacterized protein n=1 Tax=Mytilus coruscus TaxID=42192 RepID=A0A6J8B833_MYTCO|nr:unnamed protein product [Mytilus coruscus]
MKPNNIPNAEALQENTDSNQPSNSLVKGTVEDETEVEKKCNEQVDNSVTDKANTNSLVAGTGEDEDAVEKKCSEQMNNSVMSNADTNSNGEKLHAITSYVHSPDVPENDKCNISIKDSDTTLTQKSITDAPVVESDSYFSTEPNDSVIVSTGENNTAFVHDDDTCFPTDDRNKGFDSEKKPSISENTIEFKNLPDCINDVASNGHIIGELFDNLQ